MAFLTIIASPYNGDTSRNTIYLKRCVLHSIKQGEVPFAGHGFFPQYLDDASEQERREGMELGFAFWRAAIEVAFYADYGFSPGMEEELEQVSRMKNDQGDSIHTSVRRIGENP